MKLVCPHCKTSFQVDENDYAAIAAQVRNAEFETELARRANELNRQHESADKLRQIETTRELDRIKSELDLDKSKLEREIERLNGIIAGNDAVLRAELADASAKKALEISQITAAKDQEIANLQSIMDVTAKQHELEMIEARNSTLDDLRTKDQQILELTSQLKSLEVASRNRELELNEQHSLILKAKDQEIEHYKDLKSRLSTKMLGETLERHCHNMFNRARSQGQFADAYFEKDNDASGGSKGDFIFRDFINGDEYISIMFEMKHEDEKTATKHRNEDFFAKLDKDRREKQCEYAILVSTLEADNELYNEGIVDVSYRFPKMMVVRPQFFMAVISMLSRAARRGAERLVSLRQELAIAKAQTVDVTKFEERRDKFVANFSKLVDAHIKKQDDALAALDKAIDQAERQAENLRKIKASFEMSKQKLLRANEAAENDFTIKKLTHGNPTMKAKFNEARQNSNLLD